MRAGGHKGETKNTKKKMEKLVALCSPGKMDEIVCDHGMRLLTCIAQNAVRCMCRTPALEGGARGNRSNDVRIKKKRLKCDLLIVVVIFWVCLSG